MHVIFDMSMKIVVAMVMEMSKCVCSLTTESQDNSKTIQATLMKLGM